MSESKKTPPGPAADATASGAPEKIRNVKDRPTGKRALIEAAFLAAVTHSQRRLILRRTRPLVLVVRVPSTSWVKPVESYIGSYLGGDWQTYARDGSNRTRDKSSNGSNDVTNDIMQGRPVAGIAANIEILPTTLTASADIVVRIPLPNGSIISDAVRRFTGRRPCVLVDDSIIAGLDFNDIVAAFRPKSSGTEIIRRLKGASEERRGSSRFSEDVPQLATAVEYGAAREWGMALAQDIADYRAGLIPWSAIDRGVVIHSEPGLGKSLFARARECYLPLVKSSVGELFATSAGDLGAVIKAERDVFARASALAPSILFFDELDALPSRKKISDRGRDWWTPVINDFLTNLDSAVANQREGIIVVGATNFIENIDPALLRPGRLERTICIERPSLEGTVNILKHHVRDAGFSEAALIEIGRFIEFNTGAEIMMIVRDARRLARQAKRPLTVEDLRAIALPANHSISEPQLLRTSIHEAGHAVAALSLSCGVLKKAVVATGRDGSGGRTHVEFDVMADGLTRAAIEDHITMILSGRAAEKTILGAESIGAGGIDSSDLAAATSLTCSLHVSFGLCDTLAYHASIDEARSQLTYDPLLRNRVEKHLQALQQRAIELVTKHREAIEKVAETLGERRYLSGDAIRKIFNAVCRRRKRTHGCLGSGKSRGVGPKPTHSRRKRPKHPRRTI
jgi:cell division protease FtsH